jgi:hypothetical protein
LEQIWHLWGEGIWEDGKDDKRRQKRERQKAVSEESDMEKKRIICEVSISNSDAGEDPCLLECSEYQGDVISQKICV